MADFVQWADKYSVDGAEIDRQHQQLMKLINELYDAFIKKQHAGMMNDIIKKLTDYTVFHFKTEQRYFYLFNYPSMNEHLKQHGDFINKVNEFKKEVEKGSEAVFFKVITFLKTWLLNHIEKTDMELKGYFKK